MKKPQKAAIIGAGGIACTLAPILGRLMDLVIVDADDYEPSNAARQFPALTSTGNKAVVLAESIAGSTLQSVQAVPHYLQGAMAINWPEWEGVEIIFGAVDNNQSRHIIMQLAEDLGIPAILAGNSHAHGEAHLFIPDAHDPRHHFEFPDTDPPPWSCNSERTLEEFPQTAMANIVAAGCAMHLLLSWEHVANPLHAVVHSRIDTLCSSFRRAKDFTPAGTVLTAS